MRKIFLYFATITLSALALTGCREELGSTPGSDGYALVTPYAYAPVDATLNPDENAALRLFSNGKAKEFYYYAELLEDKADFIDSNGEQAYKDRVVSQGTKMTVPANGLSETVVSGLAGYYAISVVALNSSGKQGPMTEVVFYGLSWTDVVDGTYTFGFLADQGVRPENVPTTLQVADQDPTIYRFKDIFAPGFGLKVALLDQTGSDADGTFTYTRIPNQSTGLEYGARGPLSVRDVGYWQGNDSFITEGGYHSGIYFDENGDVTYASLLPAWYISEGTLSYQTYDEFVPE